RQVSELTVQKKSSVEEMRRTTESFDEERLKLTTQIGQLDEQVQLGKKQLEEAEQTNAQLRTEILVHKKIAEDGQEEMSELANRLKMEQFEHKQEIVKRMEVEMQLQASTQKVCALES